MAQDPLAEAKKALERSKSFGPLKQAAVERTAPGRVVQAPGDLPWSRRLKEAIGFGPKRKDVELPLPFGATPDTRLPRGKGDDIVSGWKRFKEISQERR